MKIEFGRPGRGNGYAKCIFRTEKEYKYFLANYMPIVETASGYCTVTKGWVLQIRLFEEEEVIPNGHASCGSV